MTNSCNDNRKVNIRAVIFDYGEVLCYRPKATDFARMAERLQVDPSSFEKLYERNRVLYDRGQMTAMDYWSGFAADVGIKIDPSTVEWLRQWDVEMWTVLNVTMTRWLENVHNAGLRTAMLSNMHADLVRHVRGHFEWIHHIDHQLFSSELGLAKPDPAIFRDCVDRVGVQPSEALFVDDREINVEVSRALGIHGIRIESVDQLHRDLEALGFAVLPLISCSESAQ